MFFLGLRSARRSSLGPRGARRALSRARANTAAESSRTRRNDARHGASSRRLPGLDRAHTPDPRASTTSPRRFLGSHKIVDVVARRRGDRAERTIRPIPPPRPPLRTRPDPRPVPRDPTQAMRAATVAPAARPARAVRARPPPRRRPPARSVPRIFLSALSQRARRPPFASTPIVPVAPRTAAAPFEPALTPLYSPRPPPSRSSFPLAAPPRRSTAARCPRFPGAPRRRGPARGRVGASPFASRPVAITTRSSASPAPRTARSSSARTASWRVSTTPTCARRTAPRRSLRRSPTRTRC